MNTKVLSEATVIEIDGIKYHHHPNGGGLVAETAFAAPSAYVDLGVIVTDRARVLDHVRLEGHTFVSGDAELSGEICARDNVIFSGDAHVTGHAMFSDNVRVCDDSDIDGDMWFSGHGLISHSRVRGSGHHNNPRIIRSELVLT